MPLRTIADVRTGPARRNALAATIEPEAHALEAGGTIPCSSAQPVLTAIGGAAGVSNLAHGRRAGTHAVEAWFMRREVGVEHAGALRLPVTSDVNACRSVADAVGLIAAA